MAGRGKENLLLIIRTGSSMELKLANMKSDVTPGALNEVETFIGSSIPNEIEFLPPEPSHTKGCGKQIKGGKEKAMEQQQKRKRLCKACKKNKIKQFQLCLSL